MENVDVRTGDLPDDLTPFITQTTLYPVCGGGFGDVWKCNYNDDANGISALVAVKAFKLGDCDLETINRKISREIGILKILRHNNIVPLWGIVTGFGRMPGLRCLVSPWMPNGTLAAYLSSNHNNLTVLDRSRMLEDVSAGLRYLHSESVMHGDITGENILIDKGGHARLIDFGLSTITQPLLGQSNLAATSIRAGAIRYAAPELILSDDVRDLGLIEKSDIYSFGCVMLQILSGRPPWSELKSERLEFRIPVMLFEGRGPQRPDGHPEIKDSDWNFIQKCLQSGPELRPSADKVLDFIMHRFHSPDSCSRPPDDPSDDAPDDFPGASPHGGSSDSDIAEQPSDSPPLHLDHELKTLTKAMEKLSVPISDSHAQIAIPSNYSSSRVISISSGSSTAPAPVNIPPRGSLHGAKTMLNNMLQRIYSSSAPSQTHRREKNIVIFGETGSGKSSVINTIAQEEVANISNDAVGCTRESKRYSVEIYGQKFALFDTAGLNSGSEGTVPHKLAKRQLKSLLDRLHESPSDGIDLLVYCVRKPTSPRNTLDAYNTVYPWTRRKKSVPIVVVVTGLEYESPMESWWDAHEDIFNSMHLAGHACVTTIQAYPGMPEDFAHRVAESSKILRDLIMNKCSTSGVDNSHGNEVLAGQLADCPSVD